MDFKIEIEQGKDAAYLATFPVEPNQFESLEFSVYNKIGQGMFGKKRKLIAAETSKIEYVGAPSEDSFCRYAVGIVNKKTGLVQIHEATPMRIDNIVKALKTNESKRIGDKDKDARNQLGQTFGTKKRKQTIKAAEINQVNVSALAGVEAKINETIAENVANMPSKETIQDTLMSDRAIPPCNLGAIEPQDVYNINDIISPSVLAAINIKPLWKARKFAECAEYLLPLNVGSFCLARMQAVLKEKKDKSLMKMLLYLAYMMKFYSLKDFTFNDANFCKRYLNDASPLIGESLQNTFLQVVGQGSETQFKSSPKGKDKNLAYILCLCLILNNYSVGIEEIAENMKLPLQTVTKSFKELGCRIIGRGKEGKKAALQIPLVFPKITRAK